MCDNLIYLCAVNGGTSSNYQQPKLEASPSASARAHRYHSYSEPSTSDTGDATNTAENSKSESSSKTEPTGGTSKRGATPKTGAIPKTGVLKKGPSTKTGAILKTGTNAKSESIKNTAVVPKTSTTSKTGATSKTAVGKTGAVPKTGSKSEPESSSKSVEQSIYDNPQPSTSKGGISKKGKSNKLLSGHWFSTSGSSTASRDSKDTKSSKSKQSLNEEKERSSYTSSDHRLTPNYSPHIRKPKEPPDRNNERNQSIERDSGENESPYYYLSPEDLDEPFIHVIIQQPRPREFTQRQSTASDPSTNPTDTKSTYPQTSTDSGTHTVETDACRHTSRLAEQRRVERNRQPFSYLEPWAGSNPDLSISSLEHAVHHNVIYHERPHFYQEGIRNVIDPRLQHDLCSATPVCSEDRRRQNNNDFPSVHRSHNVKSVRWALRQQSVPADSYNNNPPSPAPQTPLKFKERSFHEEPCYTRNKDRLHWERTAWTYEDFCKLSYNRSVYNSGPRSAVYKDIGRPGEDSVGFSYEIQNEAARALPPIHTYRQSYYGADSLSKPFRSYLGPKKTHPVQQFPEQSATSFVRNIYESYYSNKDEQPMGIMNPLEDFERKIIIEFCHLLEKSKQLFNGLRELPQYGHKQWSLYFGRTFDIYTRLWKYQQQHRAVLDSKYGMKRWQIGEIASKIGQLYYHF